MLLCANVFVSQAANGRLLQIIKVVNPTNWLPGCLVVLLINWRDGRLLYCLPLWLTGWLKAGSLSSWLIGCGMQQVVQNLNGFLWLCVCAYVHVSVRMCACFFPWLKPLSVSAGPPIASLIWHVSHSQFPPLMHDSSTMFSAGDCREESTKVRLSVSLSLSLYSAGTFPPCWWISPTAFVSVFCYPVSSNLQFVYQTAL